MNTTTNQRGVLSGARVVVGVTGSIAAYKAATLVSSLVRHGAHVDVILTASAARFVTPATFTGLTRGSVHSELFADRGLPHVRLAERADLIVVAPATAHTMARLAHGLADDLLALTVLGTRAPVLLAPAMEAGMWRHPATRRNVALLREDGVEVAGPECGRHASGAGGPGRMVEPDALLGHIRRVLGRRGDLAGLRCLTTAGGTREALDPVRVLGNRSSGKMGLALARAARDRGAEVTLVTTAPAPADSAGIDLAPVESAAEMQAAVSARLASHDVLLMAAAVADYRPARPTSQKIKKSGTGSRLELELERTEDIVAAAARQRRTAQHHQGPRVIVAFAAETENLERFARTKLEQKGVDLVVANQVTNSAGDSVFGADHNEVLLIAPDTATVRLPPMEKEQVAHHILDAVRRRLDQDN
jgi:phosphopantothenoylcysteine decarboxylase/phosphopantothenate--cysteine ligase